MRDAHQVLALAVIWTGICNEDWPFFRPDNHRFLMWCDAADLHPKDVLGAVRRWKYAPKKYRQEKVMAIFGGERRGNSGGAY